MDKLTIKVPVYQFTCVVVIDDNIEPLINKCLTKIGLEVLDHGEQMHGYAIASGDVHKYYIFYNTQSLTCNIITHEISHLIDYVFKDRDIQNPDTEIRAYLTGHICEKIFDFVLKKKLLVNKWLKLPQDKNLLQSSETLNTNSKEDDTQRSK